MSTTIPYPRNPKELNKNILLNLVLNDSENFQIIHNEISKEHGYCVLVRIKEVSKIEINNESCYEIASMEFHVVPIFNVVPGANPFRINAERSNGFVSSSSAEDIEEHHKYHTNFGNMLCLDVHLTDNANTTVLEPQLYEPVEKLILQKNQVLHFSIFVNDIPVDISNPMAAGGKQCSTRNIWIDENY
ncbi:hypothetical protein IMCC3317_40620 [Kordia antarctica]|uniref:Uncharacterized protein n=1 Tax=Kordia antarctica TaxID=1218801 RepID=A0A7L4ZPL3_9FLAO|nr:hypothetical protein [Kordia antarctica]QHI38668.1 hypothetical protein IMCC3317_40620 [Kordia antarctica]